MLFEVRLSVSTSLHYDMVNFFFMGILFTSIKFGIFSGSSYVGNMSIVWGNSPYTRVSSKYSSKFSFYESKNLIVHPLHVGLVLKEFYYIRSYASTTYTNSIVFHLKTLETYKRMINFVKQPVLYHLRKTKERRRKSIWTPFRHFIVLWIRMIGSKCHLLWDYNSDQL